MKHAHIGLVALAAMAIAGCGGGSNNKTNGEGGAETPKPFNVPLPRNHGLSEGLVEIEAGESKPTGSGASLSCPASADDDGCVLTVVKVADATGTFTATSTGGQVTVTPPVNEEAEDLKKQLDTVTNQRDQEKRRADSAEGQRDQQRQRADELVEDLAEETERADTAEQEADGKASQLRQNNARRVLAGLNAHVKSDSSTQAGTVVVTPRYGESALVTATPTTAPGLSTPRITPGAQGRWFRTRIAAQDFQFVDRLDVYSDVEAPRQVRFRDSVYNDGTAGDGIDSTDDLGVNEPYDPSDSTPTVVISNSGEVVGSLRIEDNERVSGVVASPFPKSGEPVKSFDVKDQGFTKAEIDANKDAFERNTNNPNDSGFDRNGFPENYEGPRRARDEERYPLRWTYEATGSLAGARGTFTCAAANEAAANCRVTNQNTHFTFFGPWVFTPDKSARVRVDDTEYMYFGWWARQTNPNNSAGTWTFHTFHGPAEGGTDGNRSTAAEIIRLSGTATYKGTAAGQYSFFQPLGGGHSHYGEFTANATLTANFTETGDGSGAQEETVSGTIDGFTTYDGDRTPESRSDWVVTLRQRNISGGVIPATGGSNTVTWLTDDNPTAAPPAGTWEAAFYSNLPAAQRGGASPGEDAEDATPTGIAGTFEAEYHNVGEMVGAFGAHKQ